MMFLALANGLQQEEREGDRSQWFPSVFFDPEVMDSIICALLLSYSGSILRISEVILAVPTTTLHKLYNKFLSRAA